MFASLGAFVFVCRRYLLRFEINKIKPTAIARHVAPMPVAAYYKLGVEALI
jgi:hypothetical protein